MQTSATTLEVALDDARFMNEAASERVAALVAEINARGRGGGGGGGGGGDEEEADAAPFAPEFKRWLAANPLVIEPAAPMRVTAGRECPRPCAHGGWCNRQTGACQCTTGWGGAGCEARDDYPCNLEDGGRVNSRCAGECDMDRARCRCGAGTKYPERAISLLCQPRMSVYQGWAWEDDPGNDATLKAFSHIFGSKPPPPLRPEFVGVWDETPPPGEAHPAWCDWDPAHPDANTRIAHQVGRRTLRAPGLRAPGLTLHAFNA